MGDASWVLLAADPVLTLQLKVLLVTVGALSGYVVDALGIAPRRRVAVVVPAARPLPVDPVPREPVLVAARRVPAAVRLHELGVLPALLWLSLGTGATVACR
ncbi:putative manganese transporter [Nocardioides sp. cx-169]|nr:putative manganese transporter [Nocardioides sp. cx-169]